MAKVFGGGAVKTARASSFEQENIFFFFGDRKRHRGVGECLWGGRVVKGTNKKGVGRLISRMSKTSKFFRAFGADLS